MIRLQTRENAQPPSPRRMMLGAVTFAVLWTLGMFWWSGDYTLVNFAILAVCGVLVAAAWTWAMRRFVFPR